MDIRIFTSSELKTTASEDLKIEQDLQQPDESLEETLKAYEEKQEKNQ